MIHVVVQLANRAVCWLAGHSMEARMRLTPNGFEFYEKCYRCGKEYHDEELS